MNQSKSESIREGQLVIKNKSVLSTVEPKQVYIAKEDELSVEDSISELNQRAEEDLRKMKEPKHPLKKIILNEEQVAELRRAFMDLDRDGSGRLDIKEIPLLLRTLNDAVATEEDTK